MALQSYRNSPGEVALIELPQFRKHTVCCSCVMHQSNLVQSNLVQIGLRRFKIKNRKGLWNEIIFINYASAGNRFVCLVTTSSASSTSLTAVE